MMKKALIALVLGALGAAPVTDPAPPKVDETIGEAAAKAVAYEGLKFHSAPKALAGGAVTNDWPRVLAPAHNATSDETKLLRTLPSELAVLWEAKKDSGY